MAKNEGQYLRKINKQHIGSLIILSGTICHGCEPSAGIPKESGDVKFFRVI